MELGGAPRPGKAIQFLSPEGPRAEPSEGLVSLGGNDFFRVWQSTTAHAQHCRETPTAIFARTCNVVLLWPQTNNDIFCQSLIDDKCAASTASNGQRGLT